MPQRVTLSTVSSEDLKRAGIKRKRLVFVAAKITNLTKGLITNAETQNADLHSGIEDIYACVNMDVRLALITFAFGRLNL